ncbi:MAG: D-alanine--D-alanine ligase [Candidatus Marinimicrobia bacterium CG08_land_8_20_14_0_20_45_22]|nr:MAG: D-alanine--D-alanine ligase [Candidatus Marinimicrobia bacterium CG08_land_8_20_14_0_20_45_22]
MKIAVTYSTKKGLGKEYTKRFVSDLDDEDIPPDLFAEGDSLRTIHSIINSFKENGHEVVGFESDDSVMRRLEKARPQLVFNVAEGLFGDMRESYVPLMCERLGLPYTGSGPLTLAICLNKARSKEILSYYGVPNPRFWMIFPDQEFPENSISFPSIVKPISEGSSKGIFNNSVAQDYESLRRIVRDNFDKYQQPVIVEEFLPGREFTVALWGNGYEVDVLPIISVNFSHLPKEAQAIYSYEAKWVWDTPEKPLDIFECPAKISSELRASIEKTVKRAYQVLNIRDWCRIDVRLDADGVPNVLELNPLPGILPDPRENSCFPKAARTAGYSYSQMLNRVLDISAARYGIR